MLQRARWAPRVPAASKHGKQRPIPHKQESSRSEILVRALGAGCGCPPSFTLAAKLRLRYCWRRRLQRLTVGSGGSIPLSMAGPTNTEDEASVPDWTHECMHRHAARQDNSKGLRSRCVSLTRSSRNSCRHGEWRNKAVSGSPHMAMCILSHCWKAAELHRTLAASWEDG